jgi:hypothetical protein
MVFHAFTVLSDDWGFAVCFTVESILRRYLARDKRCADGDRQKWPMPSGVAQAVVIFARTEYHPAPSRFSPGKGRAGPLAPA